MNPAREGTKAAAWYRLTVAPGETQVVRVRLRSPSSSPGFATEFDEVLATRRGEADEFYGEVIPTDVDDDARLVARQAFAGMIWGKQPAPRVASCSTPPGTGRCSNNPTSSTS